MGLSNWRYSNGLTKNRQEKEKGDGGIKKQATVSGLSGFSNVKPGHPGHYG